MNAAAYVDRAGELAKAMVSREMRGPGDLDGAMRRLEARYGIPYQEFWKLRYRKPKEIAAHVFAAIVDAHASECDRQSQLLEHERAVAKAKGGIAALAARAADFVALREGE